MRISFNVPTLNDVKGLFRAKKPTIAISGGTARPPQTRHGYDVPTGKMFYTEIPFIHNLDFYDMLRATIPPCDILPLKYISLIGHHRVNTFRNQRISDLLTEFQKKVPVNYFDKGINSFIFQLLDSGIGKGMGFGEIVPLKSLNGISYLKIARANDFRFIKEKDETLSLGSAKFDSFLVKRFSEQQYILYYGPEKRDGHPQGYSIFHSMPFVTQIYHRLLKDIDLLADRFGNASIFTILKGEANSNAETIKALAQEIQSEVTTVMQAKRVGQPRDSFVGLPEGIDIEFKILGEGGEKIIPMLRFPLEFIIDNITSKSGLPAWMLGFHRGTTERLSDNEADMIVERIKWYRDGLTPLLDRIYTMFLILTGNAGNKIEVEWDEVNLKDEKSQSQARYMNASAMEKELAIILTMQEAGLYRSKDEFTEALRDAGLIKVLELTDEQYNTLILRLKAKGLFRDIYSGYKMKI